MALRCQFVVCRTQGLTCLSTFMLFQIEDARAAMLLYQRNRREWEKNVKDQFKLKQKCKKRKPKKKQKKEETPGSTGLIS